jgi:hypothetical protein
MASRQESSLVSALKNLDLTLELEIPLGPSGSCSCSPVISLGPVKIPLGTSTPQGPISGNFTMEEMDSEIGSSLLPPTTGDQLP